MSPRREDSDFVMESEDGCHFPEMDENEEAQKKKVSGGFIERGGKQELKKIYSVLKLLSYAGGRDKLMLAVSLLAAVVSGAVTPVNVSTVLAPAVALFIQGERQFYDNESHSQDMYDKDLSSTLAYYGYTFYVYAVLSITVGFMQITLSERASQNIISKIKTDYLSKLLSVNIAWYDKSQEEFITTVTHDLEKMRGILDSRMTSSVEIISFFICGNVMGLLGSAKVALVSLFVLLFSLATIYLLIQLSKREGRKQREYTNIVTKLTGEVLGNARTVAAYGGETAELSRFEIPFSQVEKYGIRQAGILTLARAYNYFVFCICYAGAFYFAAWLYVHELFSPQHLVVVLIAQINVIYHSTALLGTLSDLLAALDSASKVMSVIQAQEASSSLTVSLQSGVRPDAFRGGITFRRVVFSYPSNPQARILKELELDIEPGKITAVVGASGAGKSTLVGLITRLYDTTSGQVLVDGRDVRSLNLSWLRDQIGVVSQEPALFDLSIEENIKLGRPQASRSEVEEAARQACAHDFIRKLPAGYNSVVGERGTKLSGGQKQRIALARALVRRPGLLLLDEATSALDGRSEAHVQEALDQAAQGRTTLVIAHRMTTVRKAHLICVMKDGVVVEKGAHAELMEQKGYYYELVRTQELEERDRASKSTSRKLSETDESTKELLQEDGYVQDEVRDELTPLKFRLKNLKVYLMWLLALFFCCLTSAFLPAFYHIFTLLCQTFSHKTEDVRPVALRNVILLLSLGILAFMAVVGSGLCSTKATQMWLGQLRRKAFRKIVSMDISWFDKLGNTPNETLETLVNSPNLIESVTGDRAAQVLIFFLSIIFTLLYSIYINTTITLVNLPIIAVFILINVWRLQIQKPDVKSSTYTTKSIKMATEYVQNVKTIQLLNCQDYIIPQYESFLQLAKKEAWKGVLFYGFVYGLARALIRIAMGSTFVFGGDIIVSGEVRGTQLLGIVISLSNASMLAGPSLVAMSQYPAARQALKQLYRIVQTRARLDVFSEKGLRPVVRGNIIFKDVDFRYPTRSKVQVLNKLNLNIEAGKTLALVGNSGCGKSTIISLLQRFYLPSAGKIELDGIDIAEMNIRYLRGRMGLVSQEPVLFDLTVRQNIVYGLDEVSDEEVISAARIANVHETILRLPQGYETMVGEGGSRLSGGQKQRVAIARAVLRDPEILLLDEATSALDTQSEKLVQDALERASVGRTTIVIAHRLSTIRKADKIVVLERGQVVEEGTHDQLCALRGHYYTLLQS